MISKFLRTQQSENREKCSFHLATYLKYNVSPSSSNLKKLPPKLLTGDLPGNHLLTCDHFLLPFIGVSLIKNCV